MILGFALLLTLLQVGVSFAEPLNLNDLERSIDVLPNFQHEFASQQHHPRFPATTNSQLQATPQAVYIKDRNSGLVLEHNPNQQYQVVIEDFNPGNIYQQWYVIQSLGFPEYYHIANSTATDPFMQVIAAGDNIATPLYLEPMQSGLPLDQLWMFRQPINSNPSNPYYNVMSAKTGLVMNVQGALKDPGTRVQVWSRNPGYNEQFTFF